MEKDNAWMMFGYRVKYNRNVKIIHENETSARLRSEIGQVECKNVSYRYELLAPYQTKRKILRVLPNTSQIVPPRLPTGGDFYQSSPDINVPVSV